MSVRNKLIAASVGVGMLLPMLAFAQTTTPSTGIQALLEQIKSLQAQLVSLQQQQVTARQQQQQVFVSLVATLKEGSIGDQVTTLQTLLALDPSLYPEGKITGYFGKLTAQAVKRFQKRHGFEQIGNVGPKTLKKLNELFDKKSSSMKDNKNDEDNDGEDDLASTTPGVGKVTICHKPTKENKTIHVGSLALRVHLAHGDTQGACTGASVKDRDDNEDDDDDNNSHRTSISDTTAPVISGILTSLIGSTTATVSWSTNEAATGKVYYGTVNPLNLGTTLNVGNILLATSHSFNLTGLTASTTYYYVLESKDAVSNTATTSGASFVTVN